MKGAQKRVAIVAATQVGYDKNKMIDYIEKISLLAKEYKAISGFDKINISDFESRLEKLYAQYVKIAHLDKPVKTIPSIFKRSYDENFISDYLAHILNPIDSGLGFSPIQSLLRFASNPFCLTENDVIGIQVFREYQLSDESRIDILIVLKKNQTAYCYRKQNIFF